MAITSLSPRQQEELTYAYVTQDGEPHDLYHYAHCGPQQSPWPAGEAEVTSFNDPTWLGRSGHIPGDGSNEPCEGCGIGVGDTRINGRFYCCDCVRKCACGEPVVDGENGTVDEEGQALCAWCHARELRHAHPERPTTVMGYLESKGEAR